MEQEERRMQRRMKEMQVQMREEAKADNVNCKVKLPKLLLLSLTALTSIRFVFGINLRVT